MAMTVHLARSGLTTSRLAFGTSRLHHLDQRKRTALLEMAVHLGFTHIDTAPSYGDTLVESEIGRVLRPHRERLVLATKYGIPPSPLKVRAAAPGVMPALKAAKAIARRVGLRRTRRAPFSAEGLRHSVEESLRRLRTDWLDLLLLHEPTPDVVVDPDGIHQALDDLQTRGHIRFYGLSGAWAGISALGDAGKRIGTVIQTGESEWPQSDPPDVAYGAIAAGRPSFSDRRVTAPTAMDRLAAALARRPDGVVLFSTTKPEHLRDVAKLAAEVESDQRAAEPGRDGASSPGLDRTQEPSLL